MVAGSGIGKRDGKKMKNTEKNGRNEVEGEEWEKKTKRFEQPKEKRITKE
jgi:hypothetical protein